MNNNVQKKSEKSHDFWVGFGGVFPQLLEQQAVGLFERPGTSWNWEAEKNRKRGEIPAPTPVQKFGSPAGRSERRRNSICS